MTPTSSTLPSIGELLDRPHSELVPCWRTVFDRPPPKRMSAPLMRRILANELQIRAARGLSRRERDKLIRLSREEARPKGPSLVAGGRLIREWNGTTHEIEVLEKGFAWRGSTYRSLSAIAESITGTRWSGPRFFGLKARGGAS